MVGVMESVDQRTQLVGKNRLELLLFHLKGRQVYGINVFKVKEVLQCPRLTSLPKSRDVVLGVSHIRGETIPIIDLGMAIGLPPVRRDDLSDCFVIITEYNRRTQGFLVSSVDRILNLNWEEIQPPPKGSGREIYLTSVAKVDDKLIEIIDVEKVLAEVSPLPEQVTESVRDEVTRRVQGHLPVLAVDDSSVARRQIERCLSAVGLEVILKNDGREALNYLEQLVADGSRLTDHLALVISDVEMPEMDGYTLVTSIKENPAMRDIYVMLHTSLSGVFNQAMVRKVGADDFMAKFSADELAERVMEIIDQS